MNNDDFFDEKILDMMNQVEVAIQTYEEEKKQSEKANHNDSKERSIYYGVKIYGKLYKFERRIFEKNDISMMVPEEFTTMSEETAKMKYPSEYRPNSILTDNTGTINILFQFMEGDVDSSTIKDFRNQVFGLMKHVNPGIKEREIGEIEINDNVIAYVEFSNNAIGGKLYNLMFYMSINGKPLMGSINCLTKDMKYWRPVAIEMMQSIELLES